MRIEVVAKRVASVQCVTEWGFGLTVSHNGWYLLSPCCQAGVSSAVTTPACFSCENAVALFDGALGGEELNDLLGGILRFRDLQDRWEEVFRAGGVDPLMAALLASEMRDELQVIYEDFLQRWEEQKRRVKREVQPR